MNLILWFRLLVEFWPQNDTEENMIVTDVKLFLPGADDTNLYMFSPCGLFPAPLGRNTKASPVNKIKSKFRFLGKFMAKSLMDSRMVQS